MFAITYSKTTGIVGIACHENSICQISANAISAAKNIPYVLFICIFHCAALNRTFSSLLEIPKSSNISEANHLYFYYFRISGFITMDILNKFAL